MRGFLSLLILLTSLSGAAQYEGDDVYDPFADYSEFEESNQEEQDINFFRNGRFFNISLLVGGRMFPGGGMTEYVEPSLSPGVALTYFFSLRLALQISYIYSQHMLGPIGGANTANNDGVIEGNLGVSSIGLDMKYYFNTANVTRGLAALNPYILGGFSQNTRTFSLVDQTIVAKDEGAGFDIGVGIEFPFARNDMYLGIQATYTYVTFSTENRPYDTSPAVYLDGDIAMLHFLIGFNFL